MLSLCTCIALSAYINIWIKRGWTFTYFRLWIAKSSYSQKSLIHHETCNVIWLLPESLIHPCYWTHKERNQTVRWTPRSWLISGWTLFGSLRAHGNEWIDAMIASLPTKLLLTAIYRLSRSHLAAYHHTILSA